MGKRLTSKRLSGRRAGVLAVAAVTAGAWLAATAGPWDPAAQASPKRGSSGSTTKTLQQTFIQVIKEASPSVVLIRTGSGLGSGIVLDSSGDVVTNNHVVTGATSVTVTTSSGQVAQATIVGAFAEGDLAVLHATGLRNLHPAKFANSSNLRVGDLVLAMGNPLGLASSVTEGIVSALGRTVSEPGGIPIPDTIQTSAAINPGNSGGALVDLEGRVVGVPTLAATDPQMGGAAVGIGFAIPSNTVKTIAGQIVKYGHVKNSHRAFLGVTAADVPTIRGALIVGVQSGGPAASAGVKAGDVIVSVDGKPTPGANALATVLATLPPGKQVTVKVAVPPTGATKALRVTLGEYPS